MKPPKTEDDKNTSGKVVVEKGNCHNCAHYHDCPRMKGINHCFNLHKVKPKKEAS
jgi:hypothetical protein